MQSQNLTATPTPSPAEVVEKATQVIDAFQNLGPLMAVLGVAALALAFALLIAWINRSGTAAVVNVLASASTQKDKDIADLKAQRAQEHKEHLESISALHNQAVRTNDLFEAMNNRGLERDKQQQLLVETQGQIVTELEKMTSVGSVPVQEIRTHVREIKSIVDGIDVRTADWNGILAVITPLLVELGALRAEAKKHSTQPIPKIDMPAETPTPEANPS